MADREEVKPWMQLFWSAWFELSTCRPPGMAGVPPIPWTAVDAYARRHRMDDDDFRTLLIVVRGLDAELAAYAEEKSKTEGAT